MARLFAASQDYDNQRYRWAACKQHQAESRLQPSITYLLAGVTGQGLKADALHA